MTNPATYKLLPLIRKIRERRRSKDPLRFTDAELLAKLARGLSSDTGDERLIACAAAVSRMAPHARRDQRGGDLRRALALLQEAGYSGFSLEQLAAVRRSAAFLELRDLEAPYVVWGKQLKDLRQAERAEFFERFRDLSIAAGAGRGRLSRRLP
jgi:hypothetical protein